jgi:hypothetical protein
MTDNEIKLEELRFNVEVMHSWFISNNQTLSAKLFSDMWEIVKEALRDKGNCKCHTHRIHGGGNWWLERFNYGMHSRVSHGTATAIKFNYCPECGRKL